MAHLGFVECGIVIEDVCLPVHARAEGPGDVRDDGLFAGADLEARTELAGRNPIEIRSKLQSSCNDFWGRRALRQPNCRLGHRRGQLRRSFLGMAFATCVCSGEVCERYGTLRRPPALAVHSISCSALRIEGGRRLAWNCDPCEQECRQSRDGDDEMGTRATS